PPHRRRGHGRDRPRRHQTGLPPHRPHEACQVHQQRHDPDGSLSALRHDRPRAGRSASARTSGGEIHAMVTATLIAVSTAALAGLGEWLHARRVARVARLAFGPTARPAAWTVAVPTFRIFGIAAAIWGGVVLANYDPVVGDQTPSPRASKQLLIALDVSPSMLI